MTSHKPGLVALIVITSVVLAVVVVFNYLSTMGLDIYESTTGDISDKFSTLITPAGWTFTIWAFIFIYQFVWMAYGLSTICRRNKKTGEYLYLSPAYSMPPALYGVYIINVLSNLTWIFVWDRSHIAWALLVIVIISATLYACVAISLVAVAKTADRLTEEGHSLEIRMIIGMVHNGLGMYTMWVTIATLINFTTVLVYQWGVAMETACLVALSILLIEIVAWVTIDFVLLDKHTRYLITPHIVIVVALTGSLVGNWNTGTTIFNMTAGMLGLGVIALVAKIIVAITRTVLDCKNSRVSQEDLKTPV